MTLRVCEGVINCTGIRIDLFKVDTSTGVHVTREGELCVEVSLPFKNPFQAQKKLWLLLLLHCLQFLAAPGVSLPCKHVEHEVS